MRRLALSIATLSMLFALVIEPTTAAAASKDVFVGTWTSIDADGSNQILFIMGSGARGRHAVTRHERFRKDLAALETRRGLGWTEDLESG